MKRSWKTTLAGISGLLAIVVKIVTTGHFDFVTDGPAIATAVGLLAAKDSNVTGGTKQQ